MGMMVRIVALLFCVAMAEYAYGAPSVFMSLLTGTTNWVALVQNIFTPSNPLFIAGVVTTIAVTAILGGTLGFGMALLFAGVGVFLLTFFTVPAQLFAVGGLPPDVSPIITGFYILLEFMFGLGLVAWIRGGEQ
jgi:hypothetical protein